MPMLRGYSDIFDESEGLQLASSNKILLSTKYQIRKVTHKPVNLNNPILRFG